MTPGMFTDLLVFLGLMATLGAGTKIFLSVVGRWRAGPDSRSNAALADIAQRLARLEQTVDATAVEVERISEGQRFTTKLLSERNKLSS